MIGFYPMELWTFRTKHRTAHCRRHCVTTIQKISETDDPDNFKKALQMLSAITQINGNANNALQNAKKVLSEMAWTQLLFRVVPM
ncbi:MAG: hypothetical protein CM1200mP39_17600 [Dehalococcoidia bacterium]|nr:MAG: hypothetical protein CM1200mP39_17600 [Dehalococcoidia bacterium]